MQSCPRAHKALIRTLHLKNGMKDPSTILQRPMFGHVVSICFSTLSITLTTHSLLFPGIIYYTMLCGSVPWRLAKQSDPAYHSYSARVRPDGSGCPTFDKLDEGPRKIIYGTLCPSPSKRVVVQDLLKSHCVSSMSCCIKIEHGKGHLHPVNHTHNYPMHHHS